MNKNIELDGDLVFVSLMYMAGFSLQALAKEISRSYGNTREKIRRKGIPKTKKPLRTYSLQCLHCEKIYRVPKNRLNISKYCSRKCKSDFENQGEILLICPVCKKTFSQEVAKHNTKIAKQYNIYCSKKCYRKRAPKVICQCPCGKEFEAFPSRLSYYHNVYCCQECYFKYGQHGVIIDYPVPKNKYQIFVAGLRKKADYLHWKTKCFKRDKERCTICASKNQLTVHHIIPVKDFIKKLGLNEKLIEDDPLWYDISNGLTICRACHKKIHVRKEEENVKD